MTSEEEKRNQRKGMYISLGVHGALLVLFFFILAWKEPVPPIPEYGIELNFGIDDQGSGTVQSPTPVTATTSEQPTEATENEQPEVEENVAEEAPENPTEETVETAEPTEEAAEDLNSPDVIEETEETPIDPQPAVEEETSEPTADNTDVETPENTGGNNQGNEENVVGDQGDPEGEVDERSLYGNPGAGGGASLDMAGWMWDYIPKPNDQSDENGRIVFSIIIDDAGEIISIRTIEKTVTPAVERIYKAEIEKLTFSTTSDNTRPASNSQGTITFIIKSN